MFSDTIMRKINDIPDSCKGLSTTCNADQNMKIALPCNFKVVAVFSKPARPYSLV